MTDFDKPKRVHRKAIVPFLDGPLAGQVHDGLATDIGLVEPRHVGDGTCWLHTYRVAASGGLKHSGSRLINVSH